MTPGEALKLPGGVFLGGLAVCGVTALAAEGAQDPSTGLVMAAAAIGTAIALAGIGWAAARLGKPPIVKTLGPDYNRATSPRPGRQPAA